MVDDGTVELTDTIEETPPAGVLEHQTLLVVIYGDRLGMRIPLSSRPTVLGRSADCDVRILQDSISRRHCIISFDGKKHVMADMGSKNGTFVNGQRRDETVLRDGDQIRLGRTILKFIDSDNIEGQYHEEIYRLMTVDCLTEVHNKRYFEAALEREAHRCRRYGRTFSLVLLDIDHFKDINDTYGHLAGDAILQMLGARLRTNLRCVDTVARVGGEEFAVIVPECQRGDAAKLAEKVRQLVEGEPFRLDEGDINVTVSLGVAEWDANLANPSELFRIADQKLYEAKRRGRNRICA